MNEAKNKVTFGLVQSWYARTYSELFPKRDIPIYLRSDTSKNKIKSEITRHLNKYNQSCINKKLSSKGRLLIKNKKYFK